MEYTADNVGKVEGLGEIYRVEAPLDRQLEAFKRAGICHPYLASVEEIAQIRLAGIQDNSSRTNIAPIAIKDKKTILFRDSPLMNPLTVSLLVDKHRAEKYFTMEKEIYEIAETIANNESGIEPEDRRAIFVSQNEDFSLTPEMDETRFLLGKHTLPYFKKFVDLGEKGKIKFYNLENDSKNEVIVNYLWFDSPQYGSLLVCRGRYLSGSDEAFGVLKAAEGSAQKIGYNLTEIKKANSENVREILGKIPELENALCKQLNAGLLKKLRSR